MTHSIRIPCRASQRNRSAHVREGSTTSFRRCPPLVRLAPDNDQIADVVGLQFLAIMGSRVVEPLFVRQLIVLSQTLTNDFYHAVGGCAYSPDRPTR
jgi:hypothetical protein